MDHFELSIDSMVCERADMENHGGRCPSSLEIALSSGDAPLYGVEMQRCQGLQSTCEPLEDKQTVSGR